MNNRHEIQLFNFSETEIRIILTPTGDIYFVASDVCKALAIGNITDAISRLDADEKTIFDLIEYGRSYEKPAITESGLYALVLSSRKPEAKAFKKWVTSEVLPSIRKTGTYTVPDMSQSITKAEVLDLLKGFVSHKDMDNIIKGMDEGLHKFFDWINENHLEETENRLQKIEGHLFPAIGLVMAFVYIIQEGNTDIYKIGMSIHPKDRAHELDTGNSQYLSLAKNIPFMQTKEAVTFETHLQEIFKEKHIKGEWYRLNAQDLLLIDRLTAVYGTRILDIA